MPSKPSELQRWAVERPDLVFTDDVETIAGWEIVVTYADHIAAIANLEEDCKVLREALSEARQVLLDDEVDPEAIAILAIDAALA